MTLTAILAFLIPALAKAADINVNIPGTNPPSAGPAGIIGNVYQFALMLGGLLAFGAIVYGGFVYTLAAGNSEKQSEGRDRITQALVGLLLLAGAAVILNFINPQILQRNASGSFTLKGIDVEGLRAYTSENPLVRNYVSPETAAYEAAARKAREDYVAHDNQANDLRAQAEAEQARADGLRAQAEAARAEGDTTTADQLDAQARGNTAAANQIIANARAEELQAIKARAEGTKQNGIYQVKSAALNKDMKGAQAYKKSLDDRLLAEARKLYNAGDGDGAAVFSAKKFEADVIMDASIIEGKLGGQLTGYSEIDGLTTEANGVMAGIVRAASARIAEAQKINDSARVAEIKTLASSLIAQVKNACAKQKMSCQNFQNPF